MSTSDRNNMSFNLDNLSEVGFTEILGTDGYDSLWGADSQILYTLEGNDSLNSIMSLNGGSLPDGGETTILVGGSGDNSYQARKNSTAIIIENSNSDDNLLYTTIGNDASVGIGLEKSSSFFAEIDDRHLYLGDTVSNQYAVLIDWQETENQIENFDLAEGRISYSDFSDRFRDAEGYRGNLTWSELAAERNLERIGLDTDSFDDELELINARALELEPSGSSEPDPEIKSEIGDFTEVIGTNERDFLSSEDAQIVYGLAGDDSLSGSGETKISVGGSGDNIYQTLGDSTTIVIENNGSDDDNLYTAVGSNNSAAVGLEKATSFFAEIDDRHLYLGDTASDLYAIVIDWQEAENQIETFGLAEGYLSYAEFVDRFRDAEGYRGNLTWSELAAERNLERLGLDTDSFDDEIDTINARALELELEPEEDLLDTDIFRFQNNNVPGTYIYVGETEAQNIRDNFDNFTEEGLAFQVAVESGDDLMPMYRFQSKVNPGTYLFVGEAERENILENFNESFTEEGLAFYTYSADSELGTDFSRFQNTAQPGSYLFATGEERANIRENFPNFEEEGIAFSVDV